ncbi:aminoglycoside phosphotransferase family protein [Halobacillus seohaensis]|uniref:Aminoglycoside phosphotransferase family protein n=1 Tax=Halobacillus seohaensis TaxID=447421 RepID=A0ABW2EHB3_9BACI
MKLQEIFVENVQSACPKEGEKWLAELPELITYCEKRWRLTMYQPYELSFNYVAPAIFDDGSEAVVKIGLPGGEHKDEIKALRSLNRKGIVKLIDDDPIKRVLILEKIQPGQMLAELEDDEKATRVAAELARNLVVPVPSHSSIPTTKERENNLKQICMDHCNGLGPISSQTLNQALQIFTYMNNSIQYPTLLHGDFHHYNVLQKGDGSWVAIDPKGIVGEIAYDLIQFLLNCLPVHGKKETIRKRVKIFTELLNLDHERFLLWGYCHTVLATAWTVDENTGKFEENFYLAIDIFKDLYKSHYHRTIIAGIS